MFACREKERERVCVCVERERVRECVYIKRKRGRARDMAVGQRGGTFGGPGAQALVGVRGRRSRKIFRALM